MFTQQVLYNSIRLEAASRGKTVVEPIQIMLTNEQISNRLWRIPIETCYDFEMCAALLKSVSFEVRIRIDFLSDTFLF